MVQAPHGMAWTMHGRWSGVFDDRLGRRGDQRETREQSAAPRDRSALPSHLDAGLWHGGICTRPVRCAYIDCGADCARAEQ